MTLTGRDLSDVGRTLSWSALRSFVEQIGVDSAIARETNPEFAIWATRTKTNALLADIFDLLAAINANLVAIGTRSKPKRPKEYPRPGKTPENEKKYGKGAMPVADLREWIAEKRRERND